MKELHLIIKHHIYINMINILQNRIISRSIWMVQQFQNIQVFDFNVLNYFLIVFHFKNISFFHDMIHMWMIDALKFVQFQLLIPKYNWYNTIMMLYIPM